MNKITTSDIEAAQSQQIHAILFQLDKELDSFTKEVQRSYALYKIGEKTDFIKHIESMLEKPVDNILSISQNIDYVVVSFLENIVSKFLKSKKNIVQEAYKTKTINKSHLYYTIVLKKDTIKNRNEVFSFLDKYDMNEISVKYPIFFKFIDNNLLNGFYLEKKVEI
jgi:hypothetical protein